MRHTDKKDFIPKLLSIARAAGEAIMAIYANDVGSVRLKHDSSPVTKADIAAHRLLVGSLGQLTPGCPVVSEEDHASLAGSRNHQRFWLVDPLDGTREFLAHNGEFTVNISLIEHGQSALGVIYAPALDYLYWGGAEIGAFRRHGANTTTIQVTSGQAYGSVGVMASKSHLDADTQAFIDGLGAIRMIQVGSSLKFCRIAEGLADIYPRLSPTCEWDTAAGQAVLEGAGGSVVDLTGQPLHYGKTNILNPPFIATRDITLIP